MVMRRHYESTKVSETQSLLDVEDLLRLHGIKTVRWTTSSDLLRIEFLWPHKGRELGFRIDVKVPAKDSRGVLLRGERRDQERRRMMRVVLNHLKAKLVAVEDGLVDFTQEFLPYLIVAGNRTAGEAMAEEIAGALKSGTLPEVRLLPSGTQG